MLVCMSIRNLNKHKTEVSSYKWFLHMVIDGNISIVGKKILKLRSKIQLALLQTEKVWKEFHH